MAKQMHRAFEEASLKAAFVSEMRTFDVCLTTINFPFNEDRRFDEDAEILRGANEITNKSQIW